MLKLATFISKPWLNLVDILTIAFTTKLVVGEQWIPAALVFFVGIGLSVFLESKANAEA